MTNIPIKIQIVKSLTNLKPSRIIVVKPEGDPDFTIYVTDMNGVPYPLKDNSGTGTITSITNTDGNLLITGGANKVININSSLLSVINSALQSGDSISELSNDVGYITLADVLTQTITDGDTTHAPSADVVYDKLLLKQNLPTGFVAGLQLSIHPTDNTKAIIAPGGYIITDFSDVFNVQAVPVQVLAPIEFTPAFLNTSPSTYIALDINQNVVPSATPFDNEDRRSLCIIGNVVHSNNININVVNEIKAPILAPTNQLHDLIKAVGFLNLDGNLFTANGANLSLNKSAGRIWGLGINGGDYLDPHRLTLPQLTALTLRYRLSNSVEFADTQFLNPTQYEPNAGGVLVPLTNNNRWGIHHLNIFQSGAIRVQPPQHEYNSFVSARNAAFTESFTTEQNIADNAIFRCYIILKKTCTDLQADIASGDAEIIHIGKFGNAIGGSTSALTLANIIAVLGYTPENEANKQNSLNTDGTGVKYPTVDAVKTEFIINEKESVRRTGIDFTGKTIYFFGDSYTSGSGASSNAYRWTTIVSKSLGAVENNNGVAGTTIQKRIPINYMASPNMVDNVVNIPTKTTSMSMLVFAFGLNDMGQTAPDYNVANYITDYNTVLTNAISKGWETSQILIIAPYYIGSAGYAAYATITGNTAPTLQRHLDFIEATRKVADDNNTMFLDIYQDQKKNNTTLITGDNIHATDAGHLYIAKDVLQYLSETPKDVQLYDTISTNKTLDNSHHGKTIWVIANSTVTIPSGLRSDFQCVFRTFTGVTLTFATSGTIINSESDVTTTMTGKKMCFLAVYTTNNYIISGGT